MGKEVKQKKEPNSVIQLNESYVAQSYQPISVNVEIFQK